MSADADFISRSLSSSMEMSTGYDDRSSGLHNLPLSCSLRDVHYSCGSCGYELNLNSCNRTSVVGCKYEKFIKKGIISFFSIDETRFTQTVELICSPYFNSRNSWGLFRRGSKLLCKKCGNHIGNAYKTNSGLGRLDIVAWDGISDSSRLYDVKICATCLHPAWNLMSCSDACGTAYQHCVSWLIAFA